MNPYRSLHVTRTGPPPARDSSELRGLAVVLVILGVLRLLPVLEAHEDLGVEAAVAVGMLAVGGFELSSLRARVQRWRRRRGRATFCASFMRS